MTVSQLEAHFSSKKSVEVLLEFSSEKPAGSSLVCVLHIQLCTRSTPSLSETYDEEGFSEQTLIHVHGALFNADCGKIEIEGLLQDFGGRVEDFNVQFLCGFYQIAHWALH